MTCLTPQLIRSLKLSLFIPVWFINFCESQGASSCVGFNFYNIQNDFILKITIASPKNCSMTFSTGMVLSYLFPYFFLRSLFPHKFNSGHLTIFGIPFQNKETCFKFSCLIVTNLVNSCIWNFHWRLVIYPSYGANIHLWTKLYFPN